MIGIIDYREMKYVISKMKNFNIQLYIAELKISKLEVTAIKYIQYYKKKKEKRKKPLNINLKEIDIRKIFTSFWHFQSY